MCGHCVRKTGMTGFHACMHAHTHAHAHAHTHAHAHAHARTHTHTRTRTHTHTHTHTHTQPEEFRHPPDIYAIGFQELVGLTASNIVSARYVALPFIYLLFLHSFLSPPLPPSFTPLPSSSLSPSLSLSFPPPFPFLSPSLFLPQPPLPFPSFSTTPISPAPAIGVSGVWNSNVCYHVTMPMNY